ncbi:MAG TPA: hypothetical protein VJQ06_12820 [Rhizomicrobium sp.]|nr:hypothetical protein [Rhizomicrobium sp.]
MELSRPAAGEDGRIFAKLEQLNSGFSKKPIASRAVTPSVSQDFNRARAIPIHDKKIADGGREGRIGSRYRIQDFLDRPCRERWRNIGQIRSCWTVFRRRCRRQCKGTAHLSSGILIGRGLFVIGPIPDTGLNLAHEADGTISGLWSAKNYQGWEK